MIGFFVGVVVGVFLMAYWLTLRLCESSSRLYILDHPNERSLHHRPTPRTGGVAIMGALCVGALLLGVFGWISTLSKESMLLVDSTGWWILMVTGVISMVSLVDDRRGLSIGMRLIAHFLAATLLVVGAGLVLPSMEVPMLGSISFGWIAVPITVVFLVWMANLYNFMDGGFKFQVQRVNDGTIAHRLPGAWQNRDTSSGACSTAAR